MTFKLTGGQANEILAQVGALVRSGSAARRPRSRKMVLGGTSMSAGTLLNYLPAHMVYRTPDMQRIYDGFMPTSNGAIVQDIDVPIDPHADDARGERQHHQRAGQRRAGQAVPALRVLRHGAHRHA